MTMPPTFIGALAVPPAPKQDDGTKGSAFPVPPVLHEGGPDSYWSQHPLPGLSPRQYAAIQLRVPDSGTAWLDAMIHESLRNEYRKAALAGAGTAKVTCIGGNKISDLTADCCPLAADLLAESRRRMGDDDAKP